MSSEAKKTTKSAWLALIVSVLVVVVSCLSVAVAAHQLNTPLVIDTDNTKPILTQLPEEQFKQLRPPATTQIDPDQLLTLHTELD